MGIQSIRLKDFQSHIDTELQFHPNYNVITGPSGSGKSSVIRACSVLFQNRPIHNFKRNKSENSFYELHANVDGHTVSRYYGQSKKKSEAINKYVMDNSEDKTWENFGTEIPKEIPDTTRIKPIVFNDKTEFDAILASQYNSHFLIFDPDPTKAKFLNRLSGSYIVDLALKDTISDLRNNSDILKDQNSIIENANILLEEKTKQYDDYSKLLKDIKADYALLQDAQSRVEALKALQVQYNSAIAKYNQITYKLSLVSQLDFETTLSKLQRMSKMMDLSNLYKYYSSGLQIVQQKLSKLNIEQFYGLVEKMQKVAKLQELGDAYRYNTAYLDKINRQIAIIDLSNAENSYNTLIKSRAMSELKRTYDYYDDQLGVINRKLAVLDVDYTKMLSSIDKYQKLKDISSIYAVAYQNVLKISDTLNNISGQMDKAVAECAKLLEATPECPYCGSKITKAKVDKIMVELTK